MAPLNGRKTRVLVTTRIINEYEFENDLTVFEWMSQWKQEGDDEQAVRSILGRLLFSQDDIKSLRKSFPVARRAVCCSAN